MLSEPSEYPLSNYYVLHAGYDPGAVVASEGLQT